MRLWGYDMRLYTADEKRMVDVGTGSIWYSIYSTAMTVLSDDAKKRVSLAMTFLKEGDCSAEKVAETKKQLMEIRKAFASLEPSKAVFDYQRPDVVPPWTGNIASSVTSCANLYTTADGKDLFTEVFELLEYASKENVSVFAG